MAKQAGPFGLGSHLHSATRIAVTLCVAAAGPVWPGAIAARSRQNATAPDCVSIGKPRPSVGYTYELTQPAGVRSQFTSYWDDISETASRVRIVRANGTVIQANEHHIADDVLLLDKTSQLSATGAVVATTVFRPGLVGDTGFRACAGRSWPIPSVTASYQSSQTKASSPTPAGTLRIVAIHEAVTVPAGTFQTVHYIRTSQSTDEYWKAIDQGVVVKHVGTLPSAVVTETLVSVK